MTAYLDYASVGIVRLRAREAMRAAIDAVLPNGSAAYGVFFDVRENARRGFAQLLDCTPNEVALTSNTSVGLQLVADGLDWRQGDEVVVFERDFAANVHPWRRLVNRGVRLRWVPMRSGGYEMADLAAAISPKTRLVAVSHVNFRTGYRIDLDTVCALAARAGALVRVDAVQSLGALPLSMRSTPVDFLSAGGQKWLCAPPGTGVFYCRSDRLALLNAAPYGWLGYEGAEQLATADYDLAPRPTARRFEGAMSNFVGLVGLAATLKELGEIGVDAVSQRIRRLGLEVRTFLRERGYQLANPNDEAWSGIVSFADPDHGSSDIHRRLTAAGCHISRPDGQLRVAPHYWTENAEIEELMDRLPVSHEP